VIALLLLLLACGGGDGRWGALAPELLDTGAAPDPGLDDAEITALAADAFALAMDVGMQPAWEGLQASIAAVDDACPSVFAGPPPTLAAEEEEGAGWSWEDGCATAAGATFQGYLWWSASIAQSEAQGETPAQATASRRLEGASRVEAEGALAQGLRGAIEDTLVLSLDESDPSWRRTTVVEAVVQGEGPFPADGPSPGGWEAAGIVSVAGGVQQTFSMAVDAAFAEPALDGAVQALSATLAWSELLVGTGCDLEPAGTLSVRVANGAWLDLGFESGSHDLDGASTCDGCARLSVDGEPTGRLICTDLRFVWDGRLAPPGLEEYVDSPRAIGLEGL
jgi:hypothetical protein